MGVQYLLSQNKKADYCYERTDHKNITVCKVNHTNYSIDHGVTNCDQAIDGAKSYSVDKLLKKIFHIIFIYLAFCEYYLKLH